MAAKWFNSLDTNSSVMAYILWFSVLLILSQFATCRLNYLPIAHTTSYTGCAKLQAFWHNIFQLSPILFCDKILYRSIWIGRSTIPFEPLLNKSIQLFRGTIWLHISHFSLSPNNKKVVFILIALEVLHPRIVHRRYKLEVLTSRCAIVKSQGSLRSEITSAQALYLVRIQNLTQAKHRCVLWSP